MRKSSIRKRVLVTGGAGYGGSHACKALGYLAKHEGAAAFNLGSGAGLTVREVIAAAERVTGRRIPVRQGPRRPGDPAALVGNAALARRELDWKPCYPKLEVIIKTAWRWLQSGKSNARMKERS